ncbi:DUF4304 domain-containing protein [Janibacter melonis]|uniref:DUF4304 domain-containing protein n=1 Tax=Janibacter melonis TaxID=262209 RepID=UPI0020940CCD|nr:DUF4304 domain-containing protein [Janibacter melonis]
MRAKDALKQALREEFVPTLRAAGFKGTYPTWRLPAGDAVAVVSIFAGQYNEGTYGTFDVMMAVVTPAWSEWQADDVSSLWGSVTKRGERHPLRALPQPGREHYWDGLARLTLTPLTPTKSLYDWMIDSVEDAQTVARQMTEALNAGQLANLLRLTDPDELLADLTTIANLSPGKVHSYGWEWDRGPHMALVAHAVLLSDYGGPELEAACQRLEQWKDPDPKITTRPLFVPETAQWARDRTARLAEERQSNHH